MTQSPDEKIYVEIPFIEQLKGWARTMGRVQQEEGVCWMVEHGRIWLIGSFLFLEALKRWEKKGKIFRNDYKNHFDGMVLTGSDKRVC